MLTPLPTYRVPGEHWETHQDAHLEMDAAGCDRPSSTYSSDSSCSSERSATVNRRSKKPKKEKQSKPLPPIVDLVNSAVNELYEEVRAECSIQTLKHIAAKRVPNLKGRELDAVLYSVHQYQD